MVAGQKAGRQAKTGGKERVQMLVPADILKAIDAEADRRGISRTLFVVSSCQTALELAKASRRKTRGS